jgi:hypothetical protein
LRKRVGLAILNKRLGTEIALFEVAHQARMPSWQGVHSEARIFDV